MRIFLLLIFAVLFCTPQRVLARIGETPQQCIARYGKPLQSSEKGMLFSRNGQKIFVTFSAGKADGIFLQKLDPATPQRALPIPDREIEQFLQMNSLGATWRLTSQLPDGDVIWLTDNSQLSAMYSQTTCSIQVYTMSGISR
jgi:hypothetical protein